MKTGIKWPWSPVFVNYDISFTGVSPYGWLLNYFSFAIWGANTSRDKVYKGMLYFGDPQNPQSTLSTLSTLFFLSEGQWNAMQVKAVYLLMQLEHVKQMWILTMFVGHTLESPHVWSLKKTEIRLVSKKNYNKNEHYPLCQRMTSWSGGSYMKTHKTIQIH